MTKHFAGARIRTLRRQHDLTQVQMAKRLDISTSYLNQLENNQRPLTVSVLLQITESFDVEATYFSDDQDLRIVHELAELLPETPEDELIDFTARYPEMARSVLRLPRPGQAKEESPYQAVREFFYQGRNFFHELDFAAEEFATWAGVRQLRLTRIATALDEEFGITSRFNKISGGPRRVFNPETRELLLRTGLTEAQQCFELAFQYGITKESSLIDDYVADLPSEESRKIARLGLAQYYAAAVTMPYGKILKAADETRYDIELIAARFGTGFESTCQRLSTLQRPGSRAVPFFFVRTDRAGNISKRQSSSTFHFSRTGGTCPLWVVHRAFETSNRITRQVAVMPDGRAYLWIARMVKGAVQAFGQPSKEFSVGLGCDLDHAHRLVYADQLNLNPAAATPIGPGCATCLRDDCAQRAFPVEGRKVALDLNVTTDAVYETVLSSGRRSQANDAQPQ
ncbi:short-chain fatty acyl-CoA regulator family protein [Corynebacterium breve]|uniref:Short-chain fatty acyl-CoA regulator family protein n=1 Tax=Corynebacterium breve TaxID=3049799 RepID=A0ABY8VEY2_9CORY|nr:short-chain fatty acyl-CoA regulator family protein [Corynebacterium breve]WIM68214.1 short-chain fatty acyl-CoA regulator family protein [Corynebacterium breve]